MNDEPDCGCGMGDDCQDDGTVPSLTVYFNPFAFDIETNNEFIRKGYEPMPIRIPTKEPRR